MGTIGSPSPSAWAARVPLELAAAAGALRLHAGVVGSVAEGSLWLRGEVMNAAIDADLSRLAPAARYEVNADGLLVPHGRSLPTGTLPAGEWTPLAELLTPAVGASSMPAAAPAPVGLRLVRSSVEREATILLTRLEALAAWAEDAPAVRLHRLRFAATATHALVWGEPLPPLRGQRYYESGGIAVPVGYAVSPAVDAASLRRVLALGEAELALFGSNGSWERIPADAFVHARRSAVRLTVKAVAGGGAKGER